MLCRNQPVREWKERLRHQGRVVVDGALEQPACVQSTTRRDWITALKDRVREKREGGVPVAEERERGGALEESTATARGTGAFTMCGTITG